MKKMTLLLCSLMLAFMASANVIVVDSVQHYPSKYAAAMDGDTLLLYSGTYKNQHFPAGKKITILAPDTCEVYLTGQVGGETDYANSSLFLENVYIGDADFLFYFRGTGTIKAINFKNCTLANVNRCSFYVDQKDITVENITFDACTLTNLNGGTWNFSWSQAIINSLTFNECTFYNNNSMESILLPRTASQGSHQFTFTHNTWFTGCRDNGRALLKAEKYYAGEECSIIIKDNVIIAPEGKVGGSLFDIRSGWWEGEITNNLIYGWTIPTLSEELGVINIENNYTLEDLGYANTGSIFADPANGDFTIYEGISALDGKASDGKALGATKWVTAATNLKVLTTGLADGVDAAAGSISGPNGYVAAGTKVTLTAVKNFGYKFVKWVDASGATLSEEATYTFDLNEDATVLAVFAAIPTYTLTINCVGGGSYTVSDAGKDGAYEVYEEGTELMIATVTNLVTEFVMGTEVGGEMYFTPEFPIVMNKDMNITLEFAQKDYICGWDDFYSGASNSRLADYVSKDYTLAEDGSNTPILEMYYTAIPGAPHGGWWNRDGKGLIWINVNVDGDQNQHGKDSTKYYKDQGYYLQTAVSTKDYKSDITFHVTLSRCYRCYHEYFVQYSYNGMSWETADTLVLNTSDTDYTTVLPQTAEQEMVYVRLYPNVDGPFDAQFFFDCYGLWFDNIFLVADSKTALDAPKVETETVIYDIMGRRLMNAEREGLYIINGKKVLVK